MTQATLAQFQPLIDKLNESSSVLITTKHHAGADGLGTALTLASVAEHLGKKADIVCLADLSIYDFLPRTEIINKVFTGARECIISIDIQDRGFHSITHMQHGNQLSISIIPEAFSIEPNRFSLIQGKFQYDAVIVLDTPDLASLGAPYTEHQDFFSETPIINIDHTPTNEQFGTMNITDPTATSTSEIIAGFIQTSLPQLMNPTIATYLLAGVIEETDSFKRAVVTPKSLTLASELISAGARREDIVAGLFQNKSLSVLKLWGRALARLQLDEQNSIYWTLLSRADFEKAEASENDIDGVMKEFTSHTPRAKAIALLYEIDGKEIGVRCKANTSLNLMTAFSPVSPAGTQDQIKAIIKGHDILSAEQMVIDILKENS